MSSFLPSSAWNGHYLEAAKPCALVRYAGATDTKGSRWLATLRRGADSVFRASVDYESGPLEAAAKACEKAGCSHWKPCASASLDGVGCEYVVLFSC